MTAVVHIVGTVVDVGPRTRQCCAWCGVLLLDSDRTHSAAEVGEDPRPPHFPPGSLLLVDGSMSVVVEHEDGAQLPANACAVLDATTPAAVHIVFAVAPDSPDLTFVEVENEWGESIAVGEWSDRDGYRVLAMPAPSA